MAQSLGVARKTASVALSATVTGLALLASGCGASNNPGVASISSGSSTGGSRSAKASVPTVADAYAASRCMRSHGVPNFPDPITINGKQYFGFYVHNGYAQGQNGTTMDANSPQYKAADRYCTNHYHLFGNTPGLEPAAEARAKAAALKFSECMRAHGASDFPDPDNTGAINLPTYNYDETPNFLHGEQACKSLHKGFVLVTPFR
jgi:hypothetical protein